MEKGRKGKMKEKGKGKRRKGKIEKNQPLTERLMPFTIIHQIYVIL
jgi:hypothetical protein